MKIAVFLAPGFEESEALVPVDMWRRAGMEVDLVSVQGEKVVPSSHQVLVSADYLMADIATNDYDALFLPGGKVGVTNLKVSKELQAKVIQHYQAGKLTCAICAGPSALGEWGLLQDKTYTCYPGFELDSFGGTYQPDLVKHDGTLITGRGMAASVALGFEVIQTLLGEEAVAQVKKGIAY